MSMDIVTKGIEENKKLVACLNSLLDLVITNCFAAGAWKTLKSDIFMSLSAIEIQSFGSSYGDISS
jgi:hypothetical protein